MKKIALYGGSFNPPPTAHRDIGPLLLEQLPIDEVWYLVTPQNPFKSTEGMAPFADRLAMTKLNLVDDPRLIVTDIEARYAKEKGNSFLITAETLRNLTRDFPDCQFIWVMGADNLGSFHTWGDANYIAENFPIVVIPRKDYTERALQSVTAQKLQQLAPDKTAAGAMLPGLYLLKTDGFDTAATQCRDEIAHGQVPKAMRPCCHHIRQVTPHLYTGEYKPCLTTQALTPPSALSILIWPMLCSRFTTANLCL